jgi:hypothetical protein
MDGFMRLIAIAGLILPTGASADRGALVSKTESALAQQIRCNERPQPARAINATLKNGLIRFVAVDDGIYLFAPNVRLTLLGLPVLHVSGFDRDHPFHVRSRSRPTEPPMFVPQFLELDVGAPASELKKRALAAGFVEAVPVEGKRGFDVKTLGHNISSIECDD